MRRSDEVALKIPGGCDNGMVRLERWPGGIELPACTADGDGPTCVLEPVCDLESIAPKLRLVAGRPPGGQGAGQAASGDTRRGHDARARCPRPLAAVVLHLRAGRVGLDGFNALLGIRLGLVACSASGWWPLQPSVRSSTSVVWHVA